jgi:hypothetical protein
VIFRLSQQLNTKIKTGTLATLPLGENPFADWSAGLFIVGRSQYILWQTTSSVLHLPATGRDRSCSNVIPATASRNSSTPFS